MCQILFKLIKERCQVMPKYRIHSGRFFKDTDCQVATVVMETVQLVLSQFENFLTYSIENSMRSLSIKNN